MAPSETSPAATTDPSDGTATTPTVDGQAPAAPDSTPDKPARKTSRKTVKKADDGDDDKPEPKKTDDIDQADGKADGDEQPDGEDGTPPAADPPPAAKTAQAAPLDPPAAPLAPPAPPTQPVQINMLATPGAEFHDLVLMNGRPADPDQMFDDPGVQYTYVVVREPIVRTAFLPNARRPSSQLLLQAGRRVPRDEAEKIKADLRAVRAAAVPAD
ncbi:hypothetical protein [Nonomuraea sp. NPDC003214]